MGQCFCSQHDRGQGHCCAKQIGRLIDRRRRSTKLTTEDLLQIEAGVLSVARAQFKEAEAVAEHKNVGHRVLVEFLTGRPNLFSAFSLNVTSTTAATLEHVHILKTVGLKLDAFFVDTLKLADQDLEQLLRSCQSLGRVHFHHGVKYNREDFHWFKQCVLTVICARTSSNMSSVTTSLRPMDNGWDILMDYVSTQMLQGILQETVKNGHNEPEVIIQFTHEGSVNSIGGCSIDEGSRKSSRSSYRSMCSVAAVSHNLLEPKDSRPFRKGSACSLSELIESYSLTERKLIRKLWHHAKLKPIGELIYSDVFEIKPALKEFFNLPVIDEESERSEEQRKHELEVVRVMGCRLEGFMDNVIHLISNEKLDRAEEVCRRVGTIHYYKHAHFTADNWLVFKRVIIFHLLEDDIACSNAERARATLEKLMLFVTKHMKNGYLEAAMSKQTRINVNEETPSKDTMCPALTLTMAQEHTNKDPALTLTMAQEHSNKDPALTQTMAQEHTNKDPALTLTMAQEHTNKDPALTQTMAQEHTNKDPALTLTMAQEHTNKDPALTLTMAQEHTNKDPALTQTMAQEHTNKDPALTLTMAQEHTNKDPALTLTMAQEHTNKDPALTLTMAHKHTNKDPALTLTMAQEHTNKDPALTLTMAQEHTNKDPALTLTMAQEHTNKDPALTQTMAQEHTNKDPALTLTMAQEHTNKDPALTLTMAQEHTNKDPALTLTMAHKHTNKDPALTLTMAQEHTNKDPALTLTMAQEHTNKDPALTLTMAQEHTNKDPALTLTMAQEHTNKDPALTLTMAQEHTNKDPALTLTMAQEHTTQRCISSNRSTFP